MFNGLKKQSGFTLLEVLLVVVIFSIVLAASFSLSNTTIFEEDLQSKSLEVSELIERARNNSATGYRGDVWGIKVLDSDALCVNSGDCIMMFKGRNFNSRETQYDSFVQFNSAVTGVYLNSNQENEFYFGYQSGWIASSTNASLEPQYIDLNSNSGDVKSILVSKAGITSFFTCGEDQIFDISGHGYNTIKIGSDCWMAENLNTGEMIASVSTSPTNDGDIEKWCYADSSANCDIYGGLYNWNEAMGYVTTAEARGICPNGWHIPSNTEWLLIDDFHSGTNLKIGGNSGFDMMIGGMRLQGSPSSYNYIDGTSGDSGLGWSSTQLDSTYAYYYWLEDALNVLNQGSALKTYGLSVRCVKDY